ncbi:MAG: hypothetical protein ACLUEV_07275 [Alistipes sp.]
MVDQTCLINWSYISYDNRGPNRSHPVRTIRFSPERGMEVNGRQVKLQGVCLHQNVGCFGSLPSGMAGRLKRWRWVCCSAQPLPVRARIHDLWTARFYVERF